MGSPLKKQRASVSGADEDAIRDRIGTGFASNISKNISEALGTSSAGNIPGTGANSSMFGEPLKRPDAATKAPQPAAQAPPIIQTNDEEEL